MRLLAEHSIERIRYSRKGREIVAVKHAVFGWISTREYVMLEELRRSGPALLNSVIEGGYKLKSTLWSIQLSPLSVFGSDVEIPVFVLFVAAALGLAAADRDNPIMAALDLASLVLPFGEIFLIVRAGIGAAQAADAIAPVITGGPPTPANPGGQVPITNFPFWIAKALGF